MYTFLALVSLHCENRNDDEVVALLMLPSRFSMSYSLWLSASRPAQGVFKCEASTCTDPFAGFSDDKASDSATTKNYVHIRIQQRNGRKSLTTVQGINKSYDYKKILKALKKEYCCNGTVVDDKELGNVIQVQGDQRKNIADFLTTVCL
jgi:translation initiation factor 1